MRLVEMLQRIKYGFDNAEKCKDKQLANIWKECAEAWELLLILKSTKRITKNVSKK